MARLGDNIWLWGQNPGSHHHSGVYKLPGVNTMSPAQGCEFFGIRNCCRVAMQTGPEPPFDDESRQLAHLHQVVWSVLGAGGVQRNEDCFGDLDEIIRQAKMFPNISGAVLDDFLSERRRSLFPPEKIEVIRSLLNQGAGRPMDLWIVYYERELEAPAQAYLDICDVITFWTWYGYNIVNLDENLARVIAATPGKRRLAGCYMWDYGCAQPLPAELMAKQLEIYRKLMHEGKLQGMILCSNCIADIGLPAVAQTKVWLDEHREEKI